LAADPRKTCFIYSRLRREKKRGPHNPRYHIDNQAWIEEYREHHKDVYEYFKGREKELLVFDVTQGDSWEKLCTFLEVDIPDQPFPVANTARNREKFVSKIKRSIRNFFKIE